MGSNKTPFYAKQITGFKFGTAPFTEAQFLTTTGLSLGAVFATNNPTTFMDLVGAEDSNNPVKSFAFMKDFTESTGELGSSSELLLGADSTGSQNSEISVDGAGMSSVEGTIVFRSNQPMLLFNDQVKCAVAYFDNNESTALGKSNFVYNNIKVVSVGNLTRNNTGLLEQKVKFIFRGGNATSTVITSTSGGQTWNKVRVGQDYCVETRTA